MSEELYKQMAQSIIEGEKEIAIELAQKSIELNDNRAVYRGRLQLDEDRAARGASLANVYNRGGPYDFWFREA